MKNTTLGGSASHVEVGKVGLGLMGMTMRPSPEDRCFECMKIAIDNGSNLLNSAEIYGWPPNRTANLDLIARFCKTYPEYKSRFLLTVKGGTGPDDWVPDSSEANLRRSVDLIIEKLGGKRLDIFECARVDPKVPVEMTMEVLNRLKAEGKFGHIGMSECSANTLRRAAKVAQIALVEIEVSPFSYEEETQKVITAAAELGVAIAAYSPVGRGFLTGTITSRDDLADGDFRKMGERFSEENFDHNLKLANALKAIAEKKNITPAQLSIAWVCSLGPHVIPIPGTTHANRALENLRAADIVLTSEEIAAIEKAMAENPVKGGRYPAQFAAFNWG